METNIALEVNNLTVTCQNGSEESCLLTNINFEVNKGSTLGITGPSGSGKSITGMTIAGLLDYTGLKVASGKITWAGQDILQFKENDWQGWRGKKISIIFQHADAALNPMLKCGKQIGEAYLTHHPGTSLKNLRNIVYDILTKAGLTDCDRVYGSYPFELSGGQQQRIAIAISIVNKPELIIADEITSSLDYDTAKEIIELLKTIQSETGCTMIMISHDMRILLDTCENILLIRNGSISDYFNVKSSAIESLSDYAKNYFSASLSEYYSDAPEPSNLTPTLIKAVDICKSYKNSLFFDFLSTKEQVVLKNISFELKEGESLGITGPSGSGKTTISKIIAGIIDVTSGSLYFKHEKLSCYTLQNNVGLRKKIQIIFQDGYAAFDPKNTVGYIMSEIINVHSINLHNSSEHTFITNWLAKFDLPNEILSKYTYQLSGGQRQRVALARTLLMAPDIIIFDESLSALDIFNQKLVLDLIMELRKIHQFSVIFISHDPALIKSTCEKTLILQKNDSFQYGNSIELIH